MNLGERLDQLRAERSALVALMRIGEPPTMRVLVPDPPRKPSQEAG